MAQAGIKDLMGKVNLASISTWADEVRKQPDFKHTAPWHYVDIPLNENSYDSATVCPNGDCIIAAIANQIAILKNVSLTDSVRQQALKFIVHFVGDLHQPLHCYDNNNHGGNKIAVTWFGETANHLGHWNLHSVWDKGIISHTGLTEAEYAAKLQQWLSTQDINKLTNGTPVEWALASHAIAQKPGTIVANNTDLSEAYFNNHINEVDQQLALAGIRLAKILNDIFQ